MILVNWQILRDALALFLCKNAIASSWYVGVTLARLATCSSLPRLAGLRLRLLPILQTAQMWPVSKEEAPKTNQFVTNISTVLRLDFVNANGSYSAIVSSVFGRRVSGDFSALQRP